MEGFKKSVLVRGNSIIGAVGDKIYTSTPVGVVQAFSGTTVPNGYLLCDGSLYRVADYPDLYNVIGNTYGGDTENFNVPDYRETVLVGVGENTTDTIASHDIYGLGEFKDDQLQGHEHSTYKNYESGATGGAGSATNYGGVISTLDIVSDGTNGTPRVGTTTHGKQKGVTYIIKAFHTNEGVDSGVSDDVVEYVDGKINDITTNTKTTWSSNKINEELEDVRSELDVIIEGANKETPIDDTVVSLTTVWSSKKTSEELAELEIEINNKADKSDIYTKTETDEKITEKVSEIVAGAPDDFDTLKEMSDWLTEHEDSAATMNSAIRKNAEDIATANTNITKNTADIAIANTNIQKHVDDITATKNDVAINKTTLGTKCKNLFKLKQNAGYTQTVSGVSFTFNGDGSITASGTLTGEAALNFSEIYLEAGTYRISSSKFFNVQIYRSGGYIGGSQATPEGRIITINDAGTYSFRWYWGGTGTVVDTTIYPMLTYTDVSDVNFKPYTPNLDTRISVLETLSDVVYKNNKSSYCSIDGYILRVGNQVHLNLTATVHTSCNAWVGSFLILPFKASTPDSSTRYTIKQTQADGRETSIYLQNGSNSFFTSTVFQKGDVITIPPTILDMYVEETTTTEGSE